ncbi:MAG TPA: MucB/RseB C-terminal domain-containing protein [Gammaproteobacteria bacterium]
MPASSCAQRSLLLLVLAAAEASAQDARDWLDRMIRAVEELNYQGTFVHVHDGTTETLQIIHRNEGGRVAERILALDGAMREIIRREDEVQCILPDHRVVLLEQRKELNPLASALPSYNADLEPNYEIALQSTARVAKRRAQVVAIQPRDEFRYGYRLWLDAETAMPLKTQVTDESGAVVEQIVFTDLDIVDFIRPEAIEPTTKTDGFTWYRPPTTPAGDEGEHAEVSWRAAQVPGGFRLSAATRGLIAGSEYPVEHLVYSDGLATVSVFIEDPKTKSDMSEGFVKMGSTNAFSLMLRGRRVTAIGEVPQQTVRTIASSLTAE